MMSHFDVAKPGETCPVCERKLEGLIAVIQAQGENPSIPEVRTCIDLKCMMTTDRRMHPKDYVKPATTKRKRRR